jgi:hypothetical protein
VLFVLQVLLPETRDYEKNKCHQYLVLDNNRKHPRAILFIQADRRELRGEFLGPIGYESSEKYMTPRCQQPAELHHFPADYKYMLFNTSMPVPGHAPATSATAVKSITGMFGRKLLAVKSRKAARKTSKVETHSQKIYTHTPKV